MVWCAHNADDESCLLQEVAGTSLLWGKDIPSPHFKKRRGGGLGGLWFEVWETNTMAIWIQRLEGCLNALVWTSAPPCRLSCSFVPAWALQNPHSTPLAPPFHQSSQLASLSPAPHCLLRARALPYTPSSLQMLNTIPGKACLVPNYEPNTLLGALEKDLVVE